VFLCWSSAAQPDIIGASAMTAEPISLATLRARVAALQAPACGMAHESIVRDADGRPVKDARNASGYAHPSLCPEQQRAAHLGCSHTMARYVLEAALERLPGVQTGALAELRELDAAIGLLDHRRYAAECRRAAALDAGAMEQALSAQAEIAAAVAEHHDLVSRVAAQRDRVLRQLDAAAAVT
jgi:hypothetical protein